jgi:ribosome-binding protein aMBF1 (putative translation factor)
MATKLMRETKTHGELIAEEMNRDPSFREEWERTEFARVVAAQLIDYRSRSGLSQRALGELLEMKQPMVARLESGESNPEIETLVNISRRLGIEFMIDIAPAARAPRLVSKTVVAQHVKQDRDGVSVVFAAASS